MAINDIRDAGCRRCNLRRDCTTICNMGVDEVITVEPEPGCMMIVGDYPSQEDDSNGLIMQSDKEKLFWTVAKDVVRVNPDYVYVTYACKCKPREGQKPSDEELLTCASSFLRKEILRVKPKVILLLGAMPMKAMGYTGVVGKERGKLLTASFKRRDKPPFETKVIITQSPTYVAYNSHELKNFALDINKAWTLSVGSDVERESPTKVTLITTIPEVEQLIEYVKQTGECAFDFEGTKLTDMGVYDPNFKATLLSVSFQHGSAYTIPLFHFETPFTDKEVLSIFKMFSEEIWANPNIRKLNQNIKFDMHIAAKYGYPLFRGRLDCTMIMHSLVDDLGKHSIKEWLPPMFPKFQGWELGIQGYGGWDKIPLRQLSEYGGVDTDAAFRGCTALETKLLSDERSYRLYRNLSIFALTTLYNMERRGMLIGRGEITKYEARALELLHEQARLMNKYPQVINFCNEKSEIVKQSRLAELRAKKIVAKGKAIDKYTQKIKNIKTGVEKVYKGINFGSTQQLGELLYTLEGFGFRQQYNKKKKDVSKATGEEILKKLGDKTGFVQDLLVYRSIKTTWSRYLKGMRLMLDEHDMVHTTFKQANTKTGRLSCVGVDTLIHTDVGYIRIGDIIPESEGVEQCRQPIKALTHTGEYKPITHVVNKGLEEMFLVELHNGLSIECTQQHIFYTDKGWKSLKDILDSQTECRIFYEQHDISDPHL